ncbi:hypothetical protein [Acinetobacter chinensis]|uniref:hypothetical protein n=1 Tax=Acinetobacter chinensis TaxID=2004650 RepID=UPI00148CFD49|nr:hypothetical protein [Acinetobacter chinensis]
MKIIYAKNSSGINEQGSFQNPAYYEKPDPGARSVVVYGDYPQIKADYEKLGIEVEVRDLPEAKPLTIDLKVGISPELQVIIDEAKAECEKVTAENTILAEQLATAQGELIAFKNDIPAMQARIDELQPAAKKPTAAEVKAAKTAEEAAKADQTKE